MADNPKQGQRCRIQKRGKTLGDQQSGNHKNGKNGHSPISPVTDMAEEGHSGKTLQDEEILPGDG